ncbi:MAG: DUF1573 domain-containing protein [Balneolia bacterium]|nr:DUF1573 domain-containing protein [Balneolia bacterium]
MKSLFQLFLIYGAFLASNPTITIDEPSAKLARGIIIKAMGSVVNNLEIVNRWAELGEVNGDKPLKATYTLKNNGDSIILIESIKPGCVFTRYEVRGYEIEPHSELEIVVHLHTTIRGYFKNYIIVEADTEQRFYSLVFEATIQ